jgi:hypothetical protein
MLAAGQLHSRASS